MYIWYPKQYVSDFQSYFCIGLGDDSLNIIHIYESKYFVFSSSLSSSAWPQVKFTLFTLLLVLPNITPPIFISPSIHPHGHGLDKLKWKWADNWWQMGFNIYIYIYLCIFVCVCVRQSLDTSNFVFDPILNFIKWESICKNNKILRYFYNIICLFYFILTYNELTLEFVLKILWNFVMDIKELLVNCSCIWCLVI